MAQDRSFLIPWSLNEAVLLTEVTAPCLLRCPKVTASSWVPFSPSEAISQGSLNKTGQQGYPYQFF